MSSSLSLSLTAAIVFATAASAHAQSPRTSPEDSQKNAAALVEFDKAGVKSETKYRIAYLTECVDNPYGAIIVAALSLDVFFGKLSSKQ